MQRVKPEIDILAKGRYQVKEILGAGGFGITYQCLDTQQNKICAIKEYMPEAIAQRDKRTGEIVVNNDRKKAYLHGKKRFLEEAEILMKMNRIPYVVKVWNFFEENNTAYYVMEYLEGTTLKQLMRVMGGKLPYRAACEAIQKAGIALDMIHRQVGIFHRDISPENIMVMPDGSVRIIDFGSAKLMAVSENQQFSVVLKPGFAPPEQYASHLSQGSFTDVYALAGTFYYIASGKMIPVAPDRLMGVNYESLERLIPECSHETSVAVDKALHLDVKFRTQTVYEFLQGIPEIRQDIKSNQTQDMHRTISIKEDVPSIPETENVVKTVQPEAWIEIVKGTGVGRIYPLIPNQPTSVGRLEKKSQIVLEGHPEISGLHFYIMYVPEKSGFYVIDESINGMYYKGIRLDKGKKYKVLPKDILGVGSTKCMITVGVRDHD